MKTKTASCPCSKRLPNAVGTRKMLQMQQNAMQHMLAYDVHGMRGVSDVF